MEKLLSIISFLHFALPRILDLNNTRISVFPQGEEFLVMLDGFFFPAFLLVLLIILPLSNSLEDFVIGNSSSDHF